MAKAKKKSSKKKSSAKKTTKAASNDNTKACAALSYLLIGIIWYFADESMKKNKLCRFHARQGLVLLIVAIIGNVVLSLIPFLGWLLLPLWQVAMLVLMVIGIINAVNEKETELPIIGQYADKFNI